MSKIDESLVSIQTLQDSTERALALAGLISTLMKIRDVELVMVGEIAYDCYANKTGTQENLELSVMSGKLTARILQDVMGGLGGDGMLTRWHVVGSPVHFNGTMIAEYPGLCRDFQTDFGVIKLIPAEELTAERILASFFPIPNQRAREEAKQLLAMALAEAFIMDWEILEALCLSKSYQVGDQLALLRQEARREAERFLAAEEAAAQAEAEPPEEIPVEEFDTGDAYAPTGEARRVVGLRKDAK
jgi:hypothetical protein